jgi:hypothetical protein
MDERVWGDALRLALIVAVVIGIVIGAAMTGIIWLIRHVVS